MGGGNTNAFNNISTNNCGGGKGPFNAGRGNAARGRGTHARGGGRGRGSPPGQSSHPPFDEDLHCAACNAIGHTKWVCPAVNCEVERASVSCAEYAIAAITDMPLLGPPSLAHQYADSGVIQVVSNCDDSHAALHSIGTTSSPLGIMPDPADVHADLAATSGAINVLSPHA